MWPPLLALALALAVVVVSGALATRSMGPAAAITYSDAAAAPRASPLRG